MTKIAVIGNGLLNWGGGVDFLDLFMRGLEYYPEEDKEIFFFYDQSYLEAEVVASKNSVSSSRNEFSVGKDFNRCTALEELQERFGGRVEFVGYEGGKSALNHCLNVRKVDVIAFSMGQPGLSNYIPWVGYVYDFQHKYLEENFSIEEISRRDKWFEGITSAADAVVCNSKAVRKDILKYCSCEETKVFSLPFSPAPYDEWLKLDSEYVKKKYQQESPYFIICNQFWVHKDHKTAFLAMRNFLNAYGHKDKVQLVCTGDLNDSRFPNYVQELKEIIKENYLDDHIRFLGHIPKLDQLALLSGAIALVQPTLFEGGPGGGSAYDAVAIGTPVIVSDILINREIDAKNVYYFGRGDSVSLSKCMLNVAEKKTIVKSDSLAEEGRLRLVRLGEVLRDMCVYAINHSTKK